jgi:hypothetical protein
VIRFEEMVGEAEEMEMPPPNPPFWKPLRMVKPQRTEAAVSEWLKVTTVRS